MEDGKLKMNLSDFSSCSSGAFPPLEDVVDERAEKPAEKKPKKVLLSRVSRVKTPLPKVKGSFRITAAWAEERKKNPWKDKVGTF
jgi:hypothetical protein